MPTAPNSIATPPTPPSRSDTATFVARADAWVGWEQTNLPLLAQNSATDYANAIETYNNAVAAAASASVAGAALWVSGTTYAIGDMRKSPATGLVYRRLTAGAGTTDPSSDSTNWVIGSAVLPQLINASGITLSAQAWAHYFLTNASACAVTLPSSPGAGDALWITVANGRIDNTVLRNGLNIMSTADDLTLTNKWGTYLFRYIDATRGWWVINVA